MNGRVHIREPPCCFRQKKNTRAYNATIAVTELMNDHGVVNVACVTAKVDRLMTVFVTAKRAVAGSPMAGAERERVGARSCPSQSLGEAGPGYGLRR